jgi:hypothetical protein
MVRHSAAQCRSTLQDTITRAQGSLLADPSAQLAWVSVREAALRVLVRALEVLPYHCLHPHRAQASVVWGQPGACMHVTESTGSAMSHLAQLLLQRL